MSLDERLHCPACGYNLRGLDDGACPECGTPFERALLARLEQPTVSTGSIVLFSLFWPAIYIVFIMPFVGLVSVLFGLLTYELYAFKTMAWLVGGGFGTLLTAAICIPVCKDLARQMARARRLRQIEAEPVSTTRLFVLYFGIELCVILMVITVILLAMDLT